MSDKTIFCDEKAREVYKLMFPHKEDVSKVKKIVFESIGIDIKYKEEN